MNRFVYADNSATTKISDAVFEAMLPYLKGEYGNPSSIYSIGRVAKAAVEEARAKVAKAIGAQPEEIYFTGCGSEADNWAVFETASTLLPKGKNHIITSAFEHHAIIHSCERLEKEGFEVTYLPVSSDGFVNPEDVKAAITDKTALVTIMYANNEIGTIQDIPAIGAICKEKGVLFHTDAVQAVGNVEIDVKTQNIDMLSLSGHKLHGPKGVGAFYKRGGFYLKNFLEGGAQENGKRAGTENVASIVGLGVAIEDITKDIPARTTKLTALRDKLITEVMGSLPRVHLNGALENRLPGSANFSFEGVEGEALLLMLDAKGICASSGSACTSGSLDPSHVLLSIGLPHAIAHGSLRLSLGDETTMEDVMYIAESLVPIINRLRDMSPLWERIIKEEK